MKDILHSTWCVVSRSGRKKRDSSMQWLCVSEVCGWSLDAGMIPIVAMSANAFDEDVRRSLASGMNAHLSKPVNIVKLLDVLVETIG